MLVVVVKWRHLAIDLLFTVPEAWVSCGKVPTLLVASSFIALAPEQWTMIPVPVKLFKLIINELGTLLEGAMTGREHEDGDSDDVSMQAPLIKALQSTFVMSMYLALKY